MTIFWQKSQYLPRVIPSLPVRSISNSLWHLGFGHRIRVVIPPSPKRNASLTACSGITSGVFLGGVLCMEGDPARERKALGVRIPRIQLRMDERSR